MTVKVTVVEPGEELDVYDNQIIHTEETAVRERDPKMHGKALRVWYREKEITNNE